MTNPKSAVELYDEQQAILKGLYDRIALLEQTEKRLLSRLSEAAHEHTKQRTIMQARIFLLEGLYEACKEQIDVEDGYVHYLLPIIEQMDRIAESDPNEFRHNGQERNTGFDAFRQEGGEFGQ